MVKYILISLFIVNYSCFALSQQLNNAAFDTVGLKDIYLDQMDQLYLEYSDGHFILYGTNRNYEYFNDFGEITSIDISNPQKILLFYREFQQIIILDNTLSSVREINLEDLSDNLLSLAIMSKRNDIWTFDEVKNTLIRMDNIGNVLSESEPIYYYQSNFTPTKIILVDNMVLLSDPYSVTMIFDNFGQYIKTINFNCVGDFSFSRFDFYCLKNNEISVYPIKPDSMLELDTLNVQKINHVRFFDSNTRNLMYLNTKRVLQMENIR